MNHSNLLGEITFSHPYITTIEDGAAKGEWTFPLYCSDAVWEIFQNAIAQEAGETGSLLDDVSMVARLNLRSSTACGEMIFTTHIGRHEHSLRLYMGRDSDRTPVLALLLPHEAP